MAEPRFAQNPETGEILELDDESGRWIPSTMGDVRAAAGGPAASVLGFLEGAFGAVSIPQMLIPGEVPPGEDIAGPLNRQRGTAVGLGHAAALASVVAPFAAPGLQLIKGAGLGALGRVTRNRAKAASVTEGLTQAQLQAETGIAQRVGAGQEFGSIRELQSAQASRGTEARLVNRDFQDFLRGEDPGILRRSAGALGGLSQSVIETSQILRGLAGTSRMAPNVKRQLFTNLFSARGAGALPGELGKGGQVTRDLFGTLSNRLNQVYTKALKNPNGKINVRESFIEQRETLKQLSASERLVFGEQMEANVLTARQLKSWREEINRLVVKGDTEIVRGIARKTLGTIDELASRSPHIDQAFWEEGREIFRFLEALRPAMGKKGAISGNDVSWQTWVNQLEKWFPEEFAEGSAAAGQLSEIGQSTLRAARQIEQAGGVRTPQVAITAVDWIIAGALGLSGAVGAGVFR